MTSDKKISVILPTYNRCERLRTALDSVCSQDVDELEVIVVDNNSTDETAELVTGYPDRRVKYTLCTKQGIYAALNHGFALAEGAYLTWTSDDNWYHPGALREMLKAIESRGADFVYCSFVILDERSGKSTITPAQEPAELERICCVGPCFLFRREVYDRVGEHSLRYRWAADYDYWLRVYRAGFRMSPVSLPLYTFLYHESSATVTRHLSVHTETVRVRLLHRCYQRHWDQQNTPAAAAESLREAAYLLIHGCTYEALSVLTRVLAYRPWSMTFWVAAVRQCAVLGRRAVTEYVTKTHVRSMLGQTPSDSVQKPRRGPSIP